MSKPVYYTSINIQAWIDWLEEIRDDIAAYTNESPKLRRTDERVNGQIKQLRHIASGESYKAAILGKAP